MKKSVDKGGSFDLLLNNLVCKISKHFYEKKTANSFEERSGL